MLISAAAVLFVPDRDALWIVAPLKTALCLALRTASFTLSLRGAASAAAGEPHELIGSSGTECALYPLSTEVTLGEGGKVGGFERTIGDSSVQTFVSTKRFSAGVRVSVLCYVVPLQFF